MGIASLHPSYALLLFKHHVRGGDGLHCANGSSIIGVTHIGLRWVSLIYSKLIPATATLEHVVIWAPNMLLKIRLLACGAAGCAYAMEGFAISHAFFHS